MFPYKRGPKKKEKCFHPHGLVKLASLNCLVSMRKDELCILCFILMKPLIKIGALVPSTLPVKGYTETPSQKLQWTHCHFMAMGTGPLKKKKKC